MVKNFSDLHTRVPPDVLPPEVSGTCNHRHDEWLQECIDNSRYVLNIRYLSTREFCFLDTSLSRLVNTYQLLCLLAVSAQVLFIVST